MFFFATMVVTILMILAFLRSSNSLSSLMDIVRLIAFTTSTVLIEASFRQVYQADEVSPCDKRIELRSESRYWIKIIAAVEGRACLEHSVLARFYLASFLAPPHLLLLLQVNGSEVARPSLEEVLEEGHRIGLGGGRGE